MSELSHAEREVMDVLTSRTPRKWHCTRDVNALVNVSRQRRGRNNLRSRAIRSALRRLAERGRAETRTIEDDGRVRNEWRAAT